MEPIPESRSQSRLRAATRPHEVGIASNRESAMSRLLAIPTSWSLVADSNLDLDRLW